MRSCARIFVAGMVLASKQDLRHVRAKFGMQGLAQIHHVIPRACAGHPTVRRLGFQIEGQYNFVLMPTHRGVRELMIRKNRLIHDGGHESYNAFVRKRLDAISTSDEFFALLLFLHRGMRRRDDDIPWL